MLLGMTSTFASLGKF